MSIDLVDKLNIIFLLIQLLKKRNRSNEQFQKDQFIGLDAKSTML